uniref:Uncharacterized protein LOC104211355 n=1 Tax=Nicotiana sylvestris TaxID=4096 RepID=A0A1U7UWZ7_NICSY|nr:PREDICTED: uncharacterized protein LOC104211355 [Nicotiana sylvestris]
MENRPKNIPVSHFKDLLDYWNSDAAKKTSETNIENRKKLKHPHTAGKTSFARIIEEKKKEMVDTSDTLSSKDIFVATRKRKPGRVYKSSYENTISKIAEMERIQSTQESGDGSDSVDTFASVMGPKHPGRARLYGRGVSKTVLKKKKKGDFGSFVNVTDERMEQKMEEMEERMQTKLLEKLNGQKEKLLEELNAQKDAMEQDITMNVVKRLQRLNPDSRHDPDMLIFSARAHDEAASAQQDAIQPINRPSAGSGVDEEMEDGGSDEDLDLT